MTVATLAAVAVGPARAQEVPPSLTLEEAVHRFAQSSPELRAARSRLRSALAEARQSRAAANPTFTFTNEDLGGYSERYFNLNQPVDFLWGGGVRGRRADANTEVAGATFQADSAAAVLDLKHAYVDAWYQAGVVDALADAHGAVSEAVEDATARVAEGDLAVYDLRRLRVGRSSLARRLQIASVELADAERRLGALVAGDGSLPRVRAEADEPVPAVPQVRTAVDVALARRPELVRARSAAAALDAQIGLARRSRFAGTSVTGGFKQQSNGQDGLFLGLHVPLPFVDRRGGAIDAAFAEAERAEAVVDLLRISIAREAALAEARLASALAQRDLIGDGGSAEGDELLSSARVAYAEGEVGVVELVDAADAFLEARLLDVEVERGVWIARIELEHVIGGFPGGNTTGAER